MPLPRSTETRFELRALAALSRAAGAIGDADAEVRAAGGHRERAEAAAVEAKIEAAERAGVRNVVVARPVDVDPDARIVLLSGYSADDGVKSLLDAGAKAFVRSYTKPAQKIHKPQPADKVRILLVICRPGGSQDVPFRSVSLGQSPTPRRLLRTPSAIHILLVRSHASGVS